MNHSEREQCNAEIDEIISRLWPSFTHRASFYPLVDLTHGQWGSRILLDLSAFLKCDPTEIGEQILAEIRSPDRQTHYKIDHGFLNYHSGLWIGGDEEFVPDTLTVSPSVIYCGAGNDDFAPQFRIACACLLHLKTILRFAESVPFITPFETYRVTSENFHSIAHIVLTNLHKRDCIDPSDLITIVMKQEGRVFMWMHPDTYRRSSLSPVMKHPFRLERRMILHAPDAPWLENIDPPSQELLTLIMSDSFFLSSALWYLSASDPGVEIDMHVISLEENANLLWLMGCIRSRLHRVAGALVATAPRQFHCTDARIQELAFRLRCLRFHQWRAATEGVLDEYVTVVRRLGYLANRFLNDTHLRNRLNTGTATEEDQQIISGVYRAVTLIYDQDNERVV